MAIGLAIEIAPAGIVAVIAEETPKPDAVL
jgi:hypothetical protein